MKVPLQLLFFVPSPCSLLLIWAPDFILIQRGFLCNIQSGYEDWRLQATVTTTLCACLTLLSQLIVSIPNVSLHYVSACSHLFSPCVAPPTPLYLAGLKKICKAIAEARNDEERIKAFGPLQEMITFVQFANDECDYGMGYELGIDLFCYGSHVSLKARTVVLSFSRFIALNIFHLYKNQIFWFMILL